MSAVAISGRMSPQLPISSHPSSQAISRPEVKVYTSPSVHLISKPLPPPPKPLNERSVKPLEVKIITAEQGNEFQDLLTKYVTAHVQITVIERELAKARLELANYEKAVEESHMKIQVGEAEIAKLDKEIAIDRASIAADRASIAADKAIIEDAKVKLAANSEALAKCRGVIEAGKTRIATNNEALAKYEEIIRTKKAQIAANDEAVAKFEEIIKAGKAKIEENNKSHAVYMAQHAQLQESAAKDRALAAQLQESAAKDRTLAAQLQESAAKDRAKIVASHAKISEMNRDFIKNAMTKILSVDRPAINSFYPKNEIDLISVIADKKCLSINEEGVKSIIIAFLKAHKNIAALNLSFFKDEMKGNALTVLLKALPETGVAQIKMGRPLSKDELDVLETVQAEYKKAGRAPLAII